MSTVKILESGDYGNGIFQRCAVETTHRFGRTDPGQRINAGNHHLVQNDLNDPNADNEWVAADAGQKKANSRPLHLLPSAFYRQIRPIQRI
jgi:hypothetical protein